MASSARQTISVPKLQALLEEQGEILRNRAGGNRDEASSQKHHGEVVNEEDVLVQRNVYKALKSMFPDAIFYGEEDGVPGCPKTINLPLENDMLYIFIDPIDGSNNYMRNGNDYAILVSFWVGYEPVLGACYFPAYERFIFGGPFDETTIDHKPVDELKKYDPDSLCLAYGLGKRKPQEIRDTFTKIVTGMTDEHYRPGCLHASLYMFMRGSIDFYASLKEEIYKVAAALPILMGLPRDGGKQTWATNVASRTVNMSEAFSLYVATVKAQEIYFEQGGELATYMEN